MRLSRMQQKHIRAADRTDWHTIYPEIALNIIVFCAGTNHPTMTYTQKLLASVRASRTVLCAGLDPVPEHLPPEIRNRGLSETEAAVTFCLRMIEQTKTGVAAYKINIAYFEALGTDAFHALNDVLDAIPSGKVLIADAKRGDVPHTNARYKTAWFDRFGFDAITLFPFIGLDTLHPFLQDTNRAAYALTLTSNPGATDLMMRPFEGASSLSEYIAGRLRSTALEHPGTLGMVIGATQSAFYGPVMQAFPEAPLLIPGVGAQGGSVDELAKHLIRHQGIPLINVSRGLSSMDPSNPSDWQMQVAANTSRYNQALQDISERWLLPDDPDAPKQQNQFS